MFNLPVQSKVSVLILAAGTALFILIPGPMPAPNDPIPVLPITPGSTAYLSDRGTSIGVGADMETLSALSQAVETRNRKAYETLIQGDQAFLVEDRVQVLVVGFHGEVAEVQFMEGYHLNESGFVPRGWLKSDRWR